MLRGFARDPHDQPNMGIRSKHITMSKKYVLITGASKGIGRACALYLEHKGMHILAGVRSEEDGAALQAVSSGRLVPIILDITNNVHIEMLAQTVQHHVGNEGLWGVVNNAGIAVAGPIEFAPPDALRRQLEVNVIGHMAVTQALLPLLRQSRGRIVMMSSIVGRMPEPMIGMYAASKKALEALTDSLRCEVHGAVHVSIIQPGVIRTPIWETSRETFAQIFDPMPPHMEQRYAPHLATVDILAQLSATKGSDPEKVAHAVAHALTARHPRTRYLVGLDAHLKAVLALLPDRIRDRLFHWAIHAIAALQK